MSIEVETTITEVGNSSITVDVVNNEAEVYESTKDLQVEINRREYSIVGDELYIPKRYEDAPQWLRDIIDTVTSQSISTAVADVSTLGDLLDSLLIELDVAKNTYTQSIISSTDIDSRINTAITTLNSTLADADSTILDIALTRVTPEQAETIALGVLTASINGGDIGASILNLQTAIASTDSARASDYTLLEASIANVDSGVTANASAIQSTNAYVGIDGAGASTNTGLSAYLEDSAGNVGGADSDVANSVYVNSAGQQESKFEYNSLLSKNGLYYSSGFGLNTLATGGTGTELDPYDSEFYINAEKFKFTNSAFSGTTAPFTIDASGATPQITFNGLVTFGSVNAVYEDTLLDTIQAYDPKMGAVPAYGSAVDSNLTSQTDGSLKLYSETDASIGLAFEAVDVSNAGPDGVSFQLSFKTGVAVTSGIYIRVNEYDADLPAGKTHVSNSAATSSTLVQEDTRQITSFYENSISATSWTTKTFKYTPTATAKWISVVVLNWDGAGLTPLYLRSYQITVNTTAAVDVSGDIDANNNIFAQKLGYIDYADMVAAAAAGTTVINGGYLNTGLIDANTINAGMINTTDLIAENIEASSTIAGNKILGTSIVGGTIEGATIFGSIIKTSWIDLLSTGYLTDWVFFTAANPPPSQYIPYFATDDLGELVPDSNGYYRLIKTKTAVFVSDAKSYVKYSYNYLYPPDYEFDIISYDEYTNSSTNKLARVRPKFIYDNGGPIAQLQATYVWHDNAFTFEFNGHTVRCQLYAAGSTSSCNIVLDGTSVVSTTLPKPSAYSYTFSMSGVGFRADYGKSVSGFATTEYLRLYMISVVDPVTNSNVIEFTEDFTTPSRIKFTSMNLSSGHDDDISKLWLYSVKLIEAADW